VLSSKNGQRNKRFLWKCNGNAETVAYQVLPAMLLNEVQKQARELARKDAQIAAMQRQLAALQKEKR
jgi:hypothetical protein